MIIQENPDKLEVENPQEEIKNSKLPVLVSCLVEDCPLCKILSPIIESVAEKHADKVKVIKVDIDKHKDFSDKYGARSAPAFLAFSDGSLISESDENNSANELISSVASEISAEFWAKLNSKVDNSDDLLKSSLEVTDPAAAIANSELPVLVDCFATWCPPCKMLSPVVEHIAEKYANKIKVIKVDIDQHRDFWNQYTTRSVPTLLFFSGGELVKTETGFKDTKKLSDIINEVLNTYGETKNSEINNSSEAQLINNTDTQTDITN